MDANANHKHVRIGKYLYSATYKNNRWECDQWPAWGPTAKSACQEYHKFIVIPKHFQEAQATTVEELHEND